MAESAIIVGAGISGLLSAYYAVKKSAYSFLKVYEARSSVGRPHCTGLVSAETADRIPFAREYVLHKYSSVKILIPELSTEVTVFFEDRGFAKIDRVGLEKRLHYELLSLGVEFSFNDPVYTVTYRGDGWVVRSKRGVNRCNSLILASGYNMRLAKAAELSCKAGVLSGIQVELEPGSRPLVGEDSVLVILSRYFGGGFAWVIPMGERTLLVGCATEPGTVESIKCLNLVLSLSSKIAGSTKSLSKPYGGAILRGYPVKPYNKKAMGVGDCVAMVKSLSGGGLYAVSIASKLVTAFIAHRYDLLKKVELLSRELKKHYFLAETVKTSIRIAEAAGIEGKRITVWTRGVSYDDYLAILLGILGNKESLFTLARRSTVTLHIYSKTVMYN